MNANTKPSTMPSAHDSQRTDTKPFEPGSAQPGKDKLLADLRAVADDAQTLLKEAMRSSAESLADMPPYLEDKLRAVKANLERGKHALEATARQATAATERYVQENPWRTIGIVVAASVVVSLLLSRASISAMDRIRGGGK